VKLAWIRGEVPKAGAPGKGAHFFGAEFLRGACVWIGEFVHIKVFVCVVRACFKRPICFRSL
jgi:hypothetical protein